MLEFIQKYWVEALFGGILSAFAYVGKILYQRVKSSQEEQEAIKIGLLSILHDRLYYLCQLHLSRGYITVSDLYNLEKLFEGYSKLGGNGTCKELFLRCKKLRIKPDGEEDEES